MERRSSRAVKWLRWSSFVVLGTLAVFVVAVLIVQRVSDGPMSALQGGPFRTGELVAGPVTDWSFVAQAKTPSEILLVGPQTSRIAGLMLRDDKLYIACDLGYMWNRDYDQPAYWKILAHTIYLAKEWHEDAVDDGRIEIRLDGKRYPGYAVKVTDPELNAALRHQLEARAEQYFGQGGLPAAPTEGPMDIWFFRVEPRTS